MKLGTRSILFGYHQFLLHPLIVALAWWKLYGFPFDPRLWVAFFVHDLGYFGKPNMDGPEGETHPEFGARVMSVFDFHEYKEHTRFGDVLDSMEQGFEPYGVLIGKWFMIRRSKRWHDFALYHSRFYAKQNGKQFSKLCVADKYAIVICPIWLQLLLMNLTGEIHEYAKGQNGRSSAEGLTQREWVQKMKMYLNKWVMEHKDCRPDTWTKVQPKVAA